MLAMAIWIVDEKKIETKGFKHIVNQGVIKPGLDSGVDKLLFKTMK